MIHRRRFLELAAASLPLGAGLSAEGATQSKATISKEVLIRGRDGAGPTWFHPRACRLPDGRVFMTLQHIGGSDYFGPVHLMMSDDVGKTWTTPEPVKPLGWVEQPDGSNEGVCDVVPEWHEASKSVLAFGHNVFYSGPKFSRDQPPRWPVYAVWKDGEWGPRRKLEWDDPRGAYIYSNNCGQKVMKADGDVAMSFTFGVKDRPREVCGVLASFDGETLRVKEVGPPLSNPQGRGLLEPSVTFFQSRYYLTIRAEDDRGYVSVSDDGLNYAPQQAWAWDDNDEPLGMSTTQQHWLTRDNSLYLVYTRKDATNVNVTRWRSPLWMAQVDPKTLRLIRSTEQVVLPLAGDGVGNPNEVALMGNFHVTHISPTEDWVTVGEWHPKKQTLGGDALLARIQWTS